MTIDQARRAAPTLEAVAAAGALPSEGWLQRIGEGAPFGPVRPAVTSTGDSVTLPVFVTRN